MNFSYNSVDAGPVPAPGALGLLGLGLLVMAGRARRA
nr:PEP-CTERM sorting domain-containing protein [Pacificimonas pallii]